ncbi:PucR family transcriptional regulator [Streptomyces sp. NPDC056112]|uniref:PucR family transcriptional regulator n=1 Tax=unclassified Streptomyces TaxID=2593676 RepID=UPI001CD62177|nr:helix-turn-helix domain-containing protein [Streptomyces sp. CoT10]
MPRAVRAIPSRSAGEGAQRGEQPVDVVGTAVRREPDPYDLTDELGVARLLATRQQSDITQAFAETVLAPLRDADHVHLLTTLRVFLENGGSSTATARALGLHRNTVAARLRQVRDRLGADLYDPGHRLALQMACRAVQPAPG